MTKDRQADGGVEAGRADFPATEMTELHQQGPKGAGRADLKGMLPEELETLVAELGQAKYRARQILSWIYEKGAADLGEMTDLSRRFREDLGRVAWISGLREVGRQASDRGQALKLLFELPGGDRIESVLMWEGKRRTACLSSQVGCALGCRFCATGSMGRGRNLTAAQIIDQLLQLGRVLREQGERVTNVVMMGMGEPLVNYDQVVRAIRLMRLEPGPEIGGRRITVSTAGHLPGIRRLAQEDLNVGLAISLNATTDEQRSQLMPINREYGIADLLAATAEFFERRGRRVTLEYVLLDGVNDTDADARRLADLTRGLRCKINLIPYNELGPRSPYRRPPPDRTDRFRHALAAGTAAAVTVRESKGQDIAAACGQLYQELQTRELRRPG